MQLLFDAEFGDKSGKGEKAAKETRGKTRKSAPLKEAGAVEAQADGAGVNEETSVSTPEESQSLVVAEKGVAGKAKPRPRARKAVKAKQQAANAEAITAVTGSTNANTTSTTVPLSLSLDSILSDDINHGVCNPIELTQGPPPASLPPTRAPVIIDPILLNMSPPPLPQPQYALQPGLTPFTGFPPPIVAPPDGPIGINFGITDPGPVAPIFALPPATSPAFDLSSLETSLQQGLAWVKRFYDHFATVAVEDEDLRRVWGTVIKKWVVMEAMLGEPVGVSRPLTLLCLELTCELEMRIVMRELPT